MYKMNLLPSSSRYTEDQGSIFIRNVGKSTPSYKKTERRQHILREVVTYLSDNKTTEKGESSFKRIDPRYLPHKAEAHTEFIGFFTELRRATICFVMCLSA
jgi:hypothetical protein